MAKSRASKPSGDTYTRSGSIGWLIAGFVFCILVTQVALTVRTAADIMAATGTLPFSPLVSAVVVFVIETALFGVLVAWGVRFATRRLMMPQSVWLALAAFPAVLALVSARGMFDGYMPYVEIVAMQTVGLTGAWFYTRRNLHHATPDLSADEGTGGQLRQSPLDSESEHIGPITADIQARIRLLATAEGGRRGPIGTDHREYRCPVGLDDAFFDCRLVTLDSSAVQPGSSADVFIEFLSPELVLPHVAVGKEFTLWEGRTIATGTVMRIINEL